MAIYDYIIVGGGISGLFMAYMLSETGKSILLFETTNRFGGRIYTKQEKNVQFELGSARISSNHDKVMSLLQELDLDDQLVKLPKDINYKLSGSRVKFSSLVKELTEESKQYSKRYLESINLLQLCIDILGYKTARTFQNMLGYDGEFEYLNAYQALRSYKQDLFTDCDYFVMKDGLSVMIDMLVSKLKERDNVKLKLEVTITDIGKNYVQTDKKKTYGTTILCCVPQASLLTYPKFKDIKEVHAVQQVPLLRIYAKYPKDKSGKVWFHGIPRTITDNYIRHIIPIDYDSGLLMISYTDGMYADMWSNITKSDNKVVIEKLHREIKEVLGKTPPKPEFITYHYWSAGVHMWKPGISVKDSYEKMLRPFPDEKIYVVNEAYSKHQCWIEGSLDACYDVLEKIDSSFKRTRVKGGADKKAKRTSDVYTIQQVLKHKNWIILDIKGKLRIYDVEKWLDDHPGGAAKLREGIEANKYYVNKETHLKSPIQLFEGIDRHSTGKVIQTMLLQEHEQVKFIGIMKKR
jgi:hypothetical protein